MVVFKKRDSVPSARYSSVCNVLRLRRIWLIPTYRVYRLYDRRIQATKQVNEVVQSGDFLLDGTNIN